MDAQKLLNLLNHADGRDWTIRFVDDDAYALKSLDVHEEFVDVYGEIDVGFGDCLTRSNAEQEAKTRGKERIPNIWYRGGKPVGKTYRVTEIESIFDNAENYFVLEPRSTEQ
ncbi:MAG: hypothetical protein RIC55_09060 [Pirellulaceae bacterium]